MHADEITFKGMCNRIPNKYRGEVRGNRTKSDLWVNLSKSESSVLFAWIAEARGGREGRSLPGKSNKVDFSASFQLPSSSRLSPPPVEESPAALSTMIMAATPLEGTSEAT